MERTRYPSPITNYYEDLSDPLSSRSIPLDEPQDEENRLSRFTDISVEDHSVSEQYYSTFGTTKTVSDLAQDIYESSTPTANKQKALINKHSLGFTAFVSNAQIISNILTGYVEYTISVIYI